ncbi:MAG: TetR/AcrR family transcriptional regulator [Candidatus Dormibacteria bacterium]
MSATAPLLRTRQTADERRDQVIAAATREFAANGYAGASTAAIAKRAGISQPYIYALFPSKQDLFIAVHDHVIGILRARFAAAVSGDTPEARLESMGALYPTLIADRHHLLVQLQSYATSDPVIRAHVASCYRRLYDEVILLSGATHGAVSLFFACGMLANVTTALDLQEICAPLFDRDAVSGG